MIFPDYHFMLRRDSRSFRLIWFWLSLCTCLPLLVLVSTSKPAAPKGEFSLHRVGTGFSHCISWLLYWRWSTLASVRVFLVLLGWHHYWDGCSIQIFYYFRALLLVVEILGPARVNSDGEHWAGTAEAGPSALGQLGRQWGVRCRARSVPGARSVSSLLWNQVLHSQHNLPSKGIFFFMVLFQKLEAFFLSKNIWQRKEEVEKMYMCLLIEIVFWT